MKALPIFVQRQQRFLFAILFASSVGVGIAGSPGARLTGEALLGQLLLRPDLTEAQRLALRQEAIGQMGLVDIDVQIEFIATDGRWLRWDATLTHYAQARTTGDVEIRMHPSGDLVAQFQGSRGAA